MIFNSPTLEYALLAPILIILAGALIGVLIEAFVGKKVFLDLRVKVEENWRKNEQKLKHWGYLE